MAICRGALEKRLIDFMAFASCYAKEQKPTALAMRAKDLGAHTSVETFESSESTVVFASRL